MIPDAERLVSTYLRSREAVADLVEDAVYTEIPGGSRAKDPLLLVRRVAGSPITSRPLHLDAPVLQLDAYGGSKKFARDLIETARAELEELEGVHELGVVTGVRFGPMSWLPDGDYTPARPRYVADVTVFLHP